MAVHGNPTGLLAVDAVGDQDAPATQLDQLACPSGDGEAAGDGGIDQHDPARSSLTVRECGIFKILLGSPLGVFWPRSGQELKRYHYRQPTSRSGAQ